MLTRAREIADDLLFPSSGAVDRADRVPPAHLDLLAAEGFYGIAAPTSDGGLSQPDGAGPSAGGHIGGDGLAPVAAIVEALASGCLATAFVWLQHHGPVRAVAASPDPAVRAGWLGPLTHGDRRAGIALAGLRGGPNQVTVERVADGYRIDGDVPWVTGWDMIDTVQLAARDADGMVNYLLIDADDGPTLGVRLQDLVAVQASRTVTVRFNGHVVGADRLVGAEPYQRWATADAPGSALNGFLALGVANRCCRLLGPTPLDAELHRCRADLLGAGPAEVPAARAAAALLAHRAAAMVAVRTGSRAVGRDSHAQRLVREAAFLLVFGSRPAIRDQIVAGLSG